MINYFFEILNLVFVEAVVLVGLFIFTAFNWKNLFKLLSLKPYDSEQRLHQDEVPRIGGLIIYTFLILTVLLSLQSQLLKIILISAIPIMYVGSKEDLFHNTSPKIRLFFMILSAFLLIYLLPTKLPEIDFPIVNKFFSFTFVKEAFFVFCILVIMNGNNLIDGVNGNMALTNIVQLCVLGLIAFSVNDHEIIQLLLVLLIPLIIFLIFNYPFGKIFSGDAGAYFYGFSISSSVIYLFGKYDQLLSWSAVLILIYPSIELLFSFIRKMFFENTSPFTADSKHLHSIIFKHFGKQSISCSNSFVILFLIPFIFAPTTLYLFFDDVFGILFLIFFIIVFYIVIYLFFLNLVSKK